MNRQEVYKMIDGERAYQQAQGKPDERKPYEWLESIEYYSENAWTNTHPEVMMGQFRKIAALAIAALEQYDCPPREGFKGDNDEQ